MTKVDYFVFGAHGELRANYTINFEGEFSNTDFKIHLLGLYRIGTVDLNLQNEVDSNYSNGTVSFRIRGKKSFELSNHLGNILEVVGDLKILNLNESEEITFVPNIKSYSDYFPFGAAMDRSNSSLDRTWNKYEIGFNGQLRLDNELPEEYHFKFRLYNAQLGKFISVDPLFHQYPFWSPYAFAGNTVIQAKDLEGAETFYTQYLENTADDITRVQARLDINETPALAVAMIMGGCISLGFTTAPIATAAYLGEEAAEELAGHPIIPDPGDLLQYGFKKSLKTEPTRFMIPEGASLLEKKRIRGDLALEKMKDSRKVDYVDTNFPVYTKTLKKEVTVLYQYRKKMADGSENSNVGQYFIDDKNITAEQVGLRSEDFELYEVRLTSDQDALYSTHVKDATVYYDPNGKRVEGGGSQIYIEGASAANTITQKIE